MADSEIGGNILGFVSKEGTAFRMNIKTGEFLTIRPTGEISTFFRRMQESLQYWAEQLQKYGN